MSETVDWTRPVDRSRLLEAMRSQGYRVTELADGALAGAWEGNTFTIALVGSESDILQVRGSWHRAIRPDHAADLHQMVNDWNRDRIWPKVYTRAMEDAVRVHAETCFDVGDGATDAQLAEVLVCGLATGVQFFDALRDFFP